MTLAPGDGRRTARAVARRLLTLTACSAAATLAAATAGAGPAPAAAAAPSVSIVAHRGASAQQPQNTLPALATAIREGADEIEVDVHLTADGTVVVTHDAVVSAAMCSGPYVRRAVAGLTLAQLRTLDCGGASLGAPAVPGTPVPTLAEALRLVRAHGAGTRVQVEVKRPATDRNAPATWARTIARVVGASGIGDRVTVISFDWEVLRQVHAAAPALRRVGLALTPTDAVAGGDTAAGAARDGLSAVSVYNGGVTPGFVASAHAAGLAVYAWTVNDPARIPALLSAGVDGIVTDRVPQTRAVLAAHGVAVAAKRRVPDPPRAAVPAWPTRRPALAAPATVYRRPGRPASATVRVVVTRTDGRAVPGATVWVTAVEWSTGRRRTVAARTDAAGSARVRVPLRRSATVTATAAKTFLRPSGVAYGNVSGPRRLVVARR